MEYFVDEYAQSNCYTVDKSLKCRISAEMKAVEASSVWDVTANSKEVK
jgi:hypothetical protein